MIVVCERCSTRFQLDESRLPARGAQVRCSRCKHAFFVAPPGASADEVVEDVVAEATGPSGSTAPAATTDLDRTLFDAGAGANPDRDEDEWEFNEDPPAGSRPRPARAAAAPEPELDLPKPPPPAAAEAEAKAASASALDDLGNPEDWDFGGAGGAAGSPGEAAPPAGRASARPAEAEEPPVPRAAEPAARPKAAAASARSRPAGRMSNLLLEAVGYLAVVLLLGTGMGRVVERAVSAAPPGTVLSAASLPVSGDGVAHVRVDFLENAIVGNMVVVSGERTTAPPGTGLEVSWMAHGTPIPGSATLAGPAIPAAWLREADPAQLRSLLAEAAARPGALPGGPPDGGAFVAVYEAVPPGATGLRVRTVAMPSAPQAEGSGGAGPGTAPQAQPPAGPASPSSPRSPLPSSG